MLTWCVTEKQQTIYFCRNGNLRKQIYQRTTLIYSFNPDDRPSVERKKRIKGQKEKVKQVDSKDRTSNLTVINVSIAHTQATEPP